MTISRTLKLIVLNWTYATATRRLAILYISRIGDLSLWAAMLWTVLLREAIVLYGCVKGEESLIR